MSLHFNSRGKSKPAGGTTDAGRRHTISPVAARGGKAGAAPEEAILFLFVQQRRGEEGLGDDIGWGVNLTRGHGGQEPPGSNPILARYTLSPVNHDSVLGMRRNGNERSRRVSLSSESRGWSHLDAHLRRLKRRSPALGGGVAVKRGGGGGGDALIFTPTTTHTATEGHVPQVYFLW